MQFKTLFLATALTTLPVGAAIAQPAAAPEAGAAQTTTAPAAAPAAGSATATAGPAATATTANPAAPTALATAQDIKAGATVFDSAGATLGTIEKVTDTGAVIAAGELRAEVPTASFAKNDRGLVIGLTKAEFEAAVNNAAS